MAGAGGGTSPSDWPLPLTYQRLPGLQVLEGVARVHSHPVGGRLRHFLPLWESITTDQWVLDIVRRGYPLPFVTMPPLTLTPLQTPVPHDRDRCTILWQEIQALLDKDAVSIVNMSVPSWGFYSHYFLAPKKGGTWRPILNLKRLNQYIHCEKFRMETLANILQVIQLNDHMISLDLKDAYLHVPILPAHRKYLRFAFRDPHGTLQVYQWNVLPFGLSTAPRVFTKVLAPIMAWLRRHFVSIYPYIDDIFLRDEDRTSILASRDLALETVLRAGFVINLTKSTLLPSQDMVHLGGRIQTVLGIVSPAQDKIDRLVQDATFLMTQTQSSARDVMRLLGRMAACKLLVPHCLFQLRPLILHLHSFYTPMRDPLHKVIPVDVPSCRDALRFWTNPDNLARGASLSASTPQFTILTDASFQGWGAVCNQIPISGTWEQAFRSAHINVLELQAVWNALRHFVHDLRGHHVLVISDNTSVVAYLNREGGTRSRSLNDLVRPLVLWCMEHSITLQAAHLAGADNLQADALSRPEAQSRRDRFKSVEWSLDQDVADRLFLRWGTPVLDLFATHLNTKVPQFCSLLPDANAIGREALSLPWDQGLVYLFPPFSLVARCLHKIVREEAETIMIAPWWPRRGWFAQLLHLMVEAPVMLPQTDQLLSDPDGLPYPDLGTLRLAAWRLSGVRSRQQAFRRQLRQPWRLPCALPQGTSTIRSGGSFVAGVLYGVSIPFSPL